MGVDRFELPNIGNSAFGMGKTKFEAIFLFALRTAELDPIGEQTTKNGIGVNRYIAMV